MLALLKLYAVEILSVAMGLWLLWISIIYSHYIVRLRKKCTLDPSDPKSNEALQEARTQRKRTYTIAVTFPSYFIFWVVVAIWGLSYFSNNS